MGIICRKLYRPEVGLICCELNLDGVRTCDSRFDHSYVSLGALATFDVLDRELMANTQIAGTSDYGAAKHHELRARRVLSSKLVSQHKGKRNRNARCSAWTGSCRANRSARCVVCERVLTSAGYT